MAKKDKLFARTDAVDAAEAKIELRLRNRREAVSRLTANADFRLWLYDTLDDLCLFGREETIMTEFGQGIRAAANRIRNRLLESPESVKMLTEFASKELAAFHEGFVAANRENENIGDKR